MAKRDETRAEGLERLQAAAIRKVKAALKERGITVPEIDGPSKDDAPLRNVQEWQALAKAFDEPENPAQAEKSTGLSFGSDAASKNAIASEMGKVSKGAKDS